MKDLYRAALGEIGSVTDRLDPGAVERALERIATARRIVVYGCGREGLMLRGLAMRLYHLGLDAHVQGEMTCPPVASGDLLIVSAGPGHLSTVIALMDVARSAGSGILFLTAEPEAEAAGRADDVLTLPAQTMARDLDAPDSTLPMGSVYEGALFILFEALVLALRDRLDIAPEDMRLRHTNLE